MGSETVKSDGSSPTFDPLTAIMPDVRGHDATSTGLPAMDQLSSRDRTIVRASAAADVGLRTLAASMVAATIAPVALAPGIAQRERGSLEFYADLASRQDPEISFPRPTARAEVHSRPANRIAQSISGGSARNLTFTSSFEPLNPDYRESWRGLTRNNLAQAQYWRHGDEPRPTLCVIHGFFASPYLLNSAWLQLPWFYKSGFDVLLYTLPFHGSRASRFSPFSGHGFFSRGLGGFAEAMAQAVHDFRVFLDHLEATGVTQFGVTGISLGGYTAALLAGVEERLQVVMPNVPVTHVPDLLESWFPASMLFDQGMRLAGISEDDLAAGSAYHSPLNYPPLLPRERRLIIAGLGDRLAPPEQSTLLWEHWDRCPLHWFPGNHIVHVSQPDYLRRMSRFMRDNDFQPHEWRNRVA